MSRQKLNLDDPLWEGEMRSVKCAGQDVLLVRRGGRILAYADRCVHKGVVLSRGCLKDNQLTCFAHHWVYDVETGAGINPSSARLKSFTVTEQENGVWIELP